MRACAKSPGRSGGTRSSVNALIVALALGSGSSTRNARAMTRSTLPSTAAEGSPKAIAATAAAV
jgi:hypothetical protein